MVVSPNSAIGTVGATTSVFVMRPAWNLQTICSDSENTARSAPEAGRHRTTAAEASHRTADTRRPVEDQPRSSLPARGCARGRAAHAPVRRTASAARAPRRRTAAWSPERIHQVVVGAFVDAIHRKLGGPRDHFRRLVSASAPLQRIQRPDRSLSLYFSQREKSL